jgi:aspartate/methionine/tyrosine aminotransferase
MVVPAPASRAGLPLLRQDAFRTLLQLHGDLERLVRTSEGRSFVSGWNAANPFVNEFLAGLTADGLDPTAYQSYSSDELLLGLIRRMHERFDGTTGQHQRVLPGDGSTGLIATFFLWLFRAQVREVCYLPTVHDTFYYFFDFLGFNVRPVSTRHPFQRGFELNLPATKSVLFLADPTWYVGRALDEGTLEQICTWQRTTESLVFVDGTWQYLQWDGTRHERSSELDPERTVRLVGPTKFLGLNGHRFSYLLVPEQLYDELADVHENLHGSTSVPNLAFARQAMTVMASKDYNRRLTDHVAGVYRRLVSAGHLRPAITPDCGLYCFAELRRGRDDCVTMGGEYYELDDYPGHVRVNLLGGPELEVLSR